MRTVFTFILTLINLCAAYAQEEKPIMLEAFTIKTSKAPKEYANYKQLTKNNWTFRDNQQGLFANVDSFFWYTNTRNSNERHSYTKY